MLMLLRVAVPLLAASANAYSMLKLPSFHSAHQTPVRMMEDVVETYDYLVIGAGSGGMASARRAAAHGAKVAVIERSRLGGTCVNVGCVPKKVMFNAASVQELIHQASGYGFRVDGVTFSLADLKARRDAYVKRLNGIYQNNLANSDIELIEGDASFEGEKLVRVGDNLYSAANVLIAVGGRPRMPSIPGIEHGINSDGFFELEKIPKRVAVVGSGYIAVELAGILNVLGSKVDLVIRRDLPLGAMEPAIVKMLVTEMEAAGINIVKGEPSELLLAAGGYKSMVLKDGETLTGYNEVLFAIGRDPVTESLNLAAANVDCVDSGHIVVDGGSHTSADGVYALGDVIGKIDLTPVAIAAGRLLADRLFGGVAEEDTTMDYDMVPTVVFSHPPLAVQGLTEQQAIDRYGADEVKCYMTTFVNMLYSREFLIEEQFQPKTAAKIVCVGPEERVVGLHMIGLAVDEILQGFSVAIKMGATKADFDSCVAIHPTSAEELVTIPPWQAKYSRSMPDPAPA